MSLEKAIVTVVRGWSIHCLDNGICVTFVMADSNQIRDGDRLFDATGVSSVRTRENLNAESLFVITSAHILLNAKIDFLDSFLAWFSSPSIWLSSTPDTMSVYDSKANYHPVSTLPGSLPNGETIAILMLFSIDGPLLQVPIFSLATAITGKSFGRRAPLSLFIGCRLFY